MTTISREELRAFLRHDFVTFVEGSFNQLNPQTEYLHNWHIEVIAAFLEECRLGKLRRLIINLPPRSLKSHMASVAFPAFLLGHNPAAQIICASYAQDLADKLAGDCRSLMTSDWYQGVFPGTRLASRRAAVSDFATMERGSRLSTSMGGVLTGRGADFIVIDDPIKPDEALSEAQRTSVNDRFDSTLITRLNNKRSGVVIIIMQRLHEDDLVGHVLQQGDWKLLKFPAIAEEDETYIVETPYGQKTFKRRAGEALHPDREPLEVLASIREIQGEYHFAGQYQQAPSPLGRGLIKTGWFKTYPAADVPMGFEMIFQSWDTANKPTELSDYCVCTTWGVKDKHIYLLHVTRKRLGYPELKRAVREQAEAFSPQTILIEDMASGTQLIQELVSEGMHAIKKYEPAMNKIMRMNSVTSTIENGFVHLPDKAAWLPDFLHELAGFPKGKYDDQVDSMSQALDWFKHQCMTEGYGLLEFYKQEKEKMKLEQGTATIPPSRPCQCGGVMSQIIPGGLRCAQCGTQWAPPGAQPRKLYLNRKDVLNGVRFR
ncbi:MAG: phage terminase large subunit [Candidatus Acidiferrales bacterium]|jgi:predicted phage terminase large subunit-like protein